MRYLLLIALFSCSGIDVVQIKYTSYLDGCTESVTQVLEMAHKKEFDRAMPITQIQGILQYCNLKTMEKFSNRRELDIFDHSAFESNPGRQI